MKVIRTFGEALEYVNRLGFGTPSKPIGWRQSDLCDVVDALERAAGISKGKLEKYPYYDAPFRVRFHTYRAGGYSYPWLGTFTVIGSTGKKTLHCSDLRR